MQRTATGDTHLPHGREGLPEDSTVNIAPAAAAVVAAVVAAPTAEKSKSIRLLTREEIARHIAANLRAVDTGHIVDAAFDRRAGMLR